MSETPQDKKPKKPSLRNVSLKKLNRKYDSLVVSSMPISLYFNKATKNSIETKE